jgi:hypothetical protein
MSWVLPEPGGAEDFFVHESTVNKIIKDKPAVFMYTYDAQRFGVSMLVDVIKTHPRVLLDGMVLENLQYLASADSLAVETASALARYPLARGPKGLLREVVTADETAAIVSRWTGTPVMRLHCAPGSWSAGSHCRSPSRPGGSLLIKDLIRPTGLGRYAASLRGRWRHALPEHSCAVIFPTAE